MKTDRPIQQKIFSRQALSEECKNWKKAGKKIVFTNGCFDILHAGHIQYLSQAAELGDILIVGVNSDQSVKRLKGESRPVNSVQSRTLLLAAISFIDAVVVFDEDTPYELIQEIHPDVLVKGGDYQIDHIVGADLVRQNGGEVIVLPYIEGFSTTEIIRQLNQSH